MTTTSGELLDLLESDDPAVVRAAIVEAQGAKVSTEALLDVLETMSPENVAGKHLPRTATDAARLRARRRVAVAR